MILDDRQKKAFLSSKDKEFDEREKKKREGVSSDNVSELTEEEKQDRLIEAWIAENDLLEKFEALNQKEEHTEKSGKKVERKEEIRTFEDVDSLCRGLVGGVIKKIHSVGGGAKDVPHIDNDGSATHTRVIDYMRSEYYRGLDLMDDTRTNSEDGNFSALNENIRSSYGESLDLYQTAWLQFLEELHSNGIDFEFEGCKPSKKYTKKELSKKVYAHGKEHKQHFVENETCLSREISRSVRRQVEGEKSIGNDAKCVYLDRLYVDPDTGESDTYYTRMDRYSNAAYTQEELEEVDNLIDKLDLNDEEATFLTLREEGLAMEDISYKLDSCNVKDPDDPDRVVADMVESMGLSARESEAFNLRLEGDTITEIADKLGIKEGSVKSMFNRIKKKAIAAGLKPTVKDTQKSLKEKAIMNGLEPTISASGSFADLLKSQKENLERLENQQLARQQEIRKQYQESVEWYDNFNKEWTNTCKDLREGLELDKEWKRTCKRFH